MLRVRASRLKQEGCHETLPPTISATRRGRCRAAGRLPRLGENLSDAAGSLDRAISAGRANRHPGTPDRSMAVGTARPALRHRQPARRRNKYRHRGGRARARGRPYAPPDRAKQRDQRDALRQAQFQFCARHRAGRNHHPPVPSHGGESIVSGQDGSRVHRLCQGQSRQAQHGVARQRNYAPGGRRAVQADGRRQPGARALSRDRSRSCSSPRSV